LSISEACKVCFDKDRVRDGFIAIDAEAATARDGSLAGTGGGGAGSSLGDFGGRRGACSNPDTAVEVGAREAGVDTLIGLRTGLVKGAGAGASGGAGAGVGEGAAGAATGMGLRTGLIKGFGEGSDAGGDRTGTVVVAGSGAGAGVDVGVVVSAGLETRPSAGADVVVVSVLEGMFDNRFRIDFSVEISTTLIHRRACEVGECSSLRR